MPVDAENSTPEKVETPPDGGLDQATKDAIVAKASQGLRESEKPPAEEKPAEAPPVEKPKDDEAEAAALAALVQEDRRLAAERAAIRKEREANSKEREQFEAVRKARESGDNVAVLKAMFPGEDLSGPIFWDLVKSLGGAATEPPEKPQALTRDDFEKLLEEMLDKRQAAANEVHAKAKADSLQNYAGACSAELKTSAAKYPLVQAYGVTLAEIEKHLDRTYAETGKVPPPSDVLAHFEKIKAGLLEKTPYARPQANGNGQQTVSSSWTSDSGGKQVPDDKGMTLSQKTDALRAKLRELDMRR